MYTQTGHNPIQTGAELDRNITKIESANQKPLEVYVKKLLSIGRRNRMYFQITMC